MKQLILDNKPYCQTDREDLISYYESLGCIEVSVIYNGNFIDPIWNGTEWIEGATQEEIEAANKPVVPESISQMKLRMQLIISGVSIASIYAMIEQISDQVQKELIYAKWEYAVVFDRNDTTLNQMAQMLGLTSEQLDEIFINGNLL